MLWLKKLLNSTVIVVRGGICHLAKGRIPRSAIHDIQQLCDDFNVHSASICIDGRGRCHFAGSIPREAQQRFRNVLASH